MSYELLRYHERAYEFGGDPLTAAASLARQTGSVAFVLYEREGEFSVACGSVFDVWMDAAGRVHSKGYSDPKPVMEPVQGPWHLPAVGRALERAPVTGFRAYGSAHYELSNVLFPGSVVDALGSPVLQLTIPRLEVRLVSGSVSIRSLDPAEVERVSRLLSDPSRAGGEAVVTPDQDERALADYKVRVAEVVEEIRAGQLTKMVLARRVPVDPTLDVLSSYVRGRRNNQPVRSFVMRQGDLLAAGYCPETLLEVSSDGTLSTQPLAGTRALTADAAENGRLRDGLLCDPKEVAEHALSVRAACEELQRACADDSVYVDAFMDIAARGTVQHLASRVRGRLREGFGPWHALESVFPAVTVSGIPKAEACRAIARHESEPRGLYGGAVLIADASGMLDAGLVLRSMYSRSGTCWLQAGAGIMGASTPERELQETREKLASVARHLVRA